MVHVSVGDVRAFRSSVRVCELHISSACEAGRAELSDFQRALSELRCMGRLLDACLSCRCV